MGWYREQLLPRIVDLVLSTHELDDGRRRAAEGLSGTIIEIGFGSGLNIPWYPSDVSTVIAIEPSETARHLAAERVGPAPMSVRYAGVDAQEVPLDTDSCDGALSTFTLCTIPDQRRALAELRRVVRPGGPIHLLEHGLARDEGVAKWQHRFEPIQRHLAGGCHLTRDHLADVEAAGLTVESSEEWYGRGGKVAAAYYLIHARA